MIFYVNFMKQIVFSLEKELLKQFNDNTLFFRPSNIILDDVIYNGYNKKTEKSFDANGNILFVNETIDVNWKDDSQYCV